MGEVYLRELATPDRAAACFRRALDIDARYAPAIRALTEILENQKAWKAIAALREREMAETADPDARVLAAMRTGALYEERLEDLEGAERCFLQALEHKPDDRSARAAVERVRGKLERWDELAQSLQDEAARTEDHEHAVTCLVRAAEIWSDHAGDLRKAVAAYIGVLEREPMHIGTLTALEPMYRQAQAWEQLAELYLRQYDAYEDRGAKVAAMTERARVLERRKIGTTDDVVDCYTSILALRQGDTGALMGLERYALKGHDPQVLAAVDLRLAQDSTDVELRGAYLTRRAESLEVAGNPEALTVYREALRLDPESRGALRGLRRIAEVLGDDEALADAARAEARIARDAREEADAWVRCGRINSERIGGAGWLAAAPLVRQRRTLGALVFFEEREDESPPDNAVLEGLGRQLGTGLDNARLHAELRAASRRADAMSRISRSLASGSDLKTVMPAFSKELACAAGVRPPVRGLRGRVGRLPAGRHRSRPRPPGAWARWCRWWAAGSGRWS